MLTVISTFKDKIQLFGAPERLASSLPPLNRIECHQRCRNTCTEVTALSEDGIVVGSHFFGQLHHILRGIKRICSL